MNDKVQAVTFSGWHQWFEFLSVLLILLSWTSDLLNQWRHHYKHWDKVMSLHEEMHCKERKTRMWANAQRDGCPAEYRWRPLFNAAVWLTPTTRVPCSNAAKTQNPLKSPWAPQTNETISAASGPKFTISWGHVKEILLLKKFFSDCRYMSRYNLRTRKQ